MGWGFLMTMLKPKVFLDQAPGEVYYLTKDRLVVGFDRPLVIDTPVTLTIICDNQNVMIQGAVEVIARRHQKYVGTIVWQDSLQKQILDALLSSAAGDFEPPKLPVVVANEFQKETPSEAENLSQAFLRRKRRGYVELTCLIVLLMVGIVWGVWQTFFRIYVDAPFAAITVPLRVMMAPDFGQVIWSTSVQPSEALHQGQILGTMVSPKLQEAKERLESDLSFLKIQIEGLRAKKQDAALRISYRQQSAQDLLRQKKERLRAAQVDYEQALTQKRRLTPLYQKGYLSHIKWDTLKAGIIKTKTAVNEAQAALDQTKTDNQMIMASLDVPVGVTPQDLDQQISEKIAQRENLKRQRRLLDERFQSLTLTSPCDCRIVSSQSDKAWVNPGAVLMRLQEDSDEALVVEARLPASVANRVQVGDAAWISVGDQGDDVSARVVDIRPMAATERYGLSPMIMQDPSLTSVYLKPVHGNLRPHKAGTHVNVSIHKPNIFDYLKRIF
jgi:multidrug resistance efflux pump